jgi:hypothetical protein
MTAVVGDQKQPDVLLVGPVSTREQEIGADERRDLAAETLTFELAARDREDPAPAHRRLTELDWRVQIKGELEKVPRLQGHSKNLLYYLPLTSPRRAADQDALCVSSSQEKMVRLERVAGIEPAYSAWKAAALPLSYTRARHAYA